MDTQNEELVVTGLKIFRACLLSIIEKVNSKVITSVKGNELSNELIDDYTDLILDCQSGLNE